MYNNVKPLTIQIEFLRKVSMNNNQELKLYKKSLVQQ